MVFHLLETLFLVPARVALEGRFSIFASGLVPSCSTEQSWCSWMAIHAVYLMDKLGSVIRYDAIESSPGHWIRTVVFYWFLCYFQACFFTRKMSISVSYECDSLGDDGSQGHRSRPELNDLFCVSCFRISGCLWILGISPRATALRIAFAIFR